MKKLLLLILIVGTSKKANCQTWSSYSSFPGGARYGAISAQVGNKGYFGLGVSSGNPQNDFWQFDFVTNIWTALPNFPGSKRYDASAFVIGNSIYVGGGDENIKDIEGNTGFYREDYYVFNTQTNTWNQIANFPDSRGESFAFAINGKGYVVCGNTSQNGWRREMYSFDPTSGIWTRKADFPGTRRSYPVGFAIGNKAYVGGGYQGGWTLCCEVTPEYFNDFYQYDTSTDSWISKGQTVNGVEANGWIAQAVGLATCDKGYLISGNVSQQKGYWYPDCCSSVVLEYDPVANAWSSMASLPSPLNQGIGWLFNGVLYAGLGSSTSTIYSFGLLPINGNTVICSTGSYSVSGLSQGYTVSWSSSNTTGLTIDPNTGTATRLNNYNGSITITATINNACGTALLKNIWLGTPTDAPGPISGNTSPNIGYTEFYYSSGPPIGAVDQGITSYTWILPYSSKTDPNWTPWKIDRYNTNLGIFAIVGSGQGYVQAVSVNACGPGGAARLFVVPGGTPGCNPCQSPTINPYPNPADKDLQIGLGDGMKEVILYNSSQVEVFDIWTTENQISISVQSFPEGIYYLHIINDDKDIQHQVIIRHH